MALKIEHTNHKDYLEVALVGKRSPQLEYEEISIIWSSIFQLCAKYGQKNLLAHIKAIGRLPLRSRINYAFTLEEMGWTEHHKVAAVSNNSEYVHDVQIVEQYINGVGYNVKVFTNEADALIWLLNDQVELKIHRNIQ
jgi:hypothetical protein